MFSVRNPISIGNLTGIFRKAEDFGYIFYKHSLYPPIKEDHFYCFFITRCSSTIFLGWFSAPVVQSLGGTMVSMVARSSWVSNCSYIWFHTQGVSCETSQVPFCEPPQGPFRRLFAHRLTGHNPPVVPRIQFPQPEHRSQKIPCSTGPPMKVVFRPGKILILGNLSAIY